MTKYTLLDTKKLALKIMLVFSIFYQLLLKSCEEL